MNEIEMKQRTKAFALRIIRLCKALPTTTEGLVLRKQLVRCGTSVGANYRAACRARSNAEFISKIGIVIEEGDESAFWLEIIIEGNFIKKELVLPLLQETNEIVAMMVATSNTMQRKIEK